MDTQAKDRIALAIRLARQARSKGWNRDRWVRSYQNSRQDLNETVAHNIATIAASKVWV